jgi:hypothetical protein
MPRTVTWIVAAGLAALGLAAAVDALRQEPEQISVPRERTSTDVDLGLPQLSEHVAVRQLREAGVSGVLTYSDDECRLHALSLPELEPAPAPSFQMCRPLTDAGGVGVSEGSVVWAGLGLGIVQEIISHEELSRAIRIGLGSSPGGSETFTAVQAVALEDDRYVVLADSTYEPRERVLAAFEGGRPLYVHPRWRVYDAGAIRPSPEGHYYALMGDDPNPRIFTRDGGEVGFPQGVPKALAVTWSPDDRWTALATEESVYIFPSERPEGPVVRIPVAVRDLDWTAEPQVPNVP